MGKNVQDRNQLLSNYLEGMLSAEEELLLADWLNESSENYQLFKKYITQNQFSRLNSDETVRAWEKLRNRVLSEKRTEVRSSFSRLLKGAAIIVIAVLSGVFASHFWGEYTSKSRLNEIVVPNGNKARLILSDGTRIFLNAGTHFKYPSNFSGSQRKVIMNGEGFFEVAKDRVHPFVIETPKFTVKVTGTTFNLNTYCGDDINSVTLKTGIVTVIHSNHQLKLCPGQKYILNRQTEGSKIEATNLDQFNLWTQGITVIDNLDLDEIRKILERKFDVHIHILNKGYQKIRYSGQFEPYETLGDMLNLIKGASPVKFNYTVDLKRKEVTIE